MGADFIKVFSDVAAANWHAILETAAAHSLPVDGHVPDEVTLVHIEAHRPTGPLSDDPRWIYLRPDEQDRWIALLGTLTPEDIELAIERWPILRRIAATLDRAGITYLAGTDTPMPGVYPGFSLHEELSLLVQAGLRPLDVLRAATLSPAEFLGVDDVTGSIAVGHRADLVFLDADPTRDIRHTQRIRAVAFDGRLLQRTELDALLIAHQ